MKPRRAGLYDRALIAERSRAGVARARAQGIHCGRPRLEVDVAPAIVLIRRGYGLRKVAEALEVSVPTLRRRLRECGEWPRTTPAAEPARDRGPLPGNHERGEPRETRVSFDNEVIP